MSSSLNILFEDNHLLIIDKPPLLATMGTNEEHDSLVKQSQDYLRKKYAKPGKVYIGVVSRLDSHVSGLIVLARTSKAASRLSDQFRRRVPLKTYLALVPDLQELPDSGRLENRLVKNESQHRMVVLSDSAARQSQEKQAVLVYRTLARAAGLRLLEIQLETGRKHQIRVQLANVGCPIVGDRKYDSVLNFPRGIALHSHRLVFEHPTKKSRQSFQSDPPPFWRLQRFGYDKLD